MLHRFQEKYIPEPNSGCWLWTAYCDKRGYARFSVRRKWGHAHRVSYELFVGPIPAGLELDHKCRNPSCVNPDHLEPVTHAENVRRAAVVVGNFGKAGRSKTHCPQGHAYDEANTYVTPIGDRQCRICRRYHVKETYKRKRR